LSELKVKVLDWMAYGQVGISSKAMALASLNMEQERTWGDTHPHDPDDLNRCLLFLHHVPEARENLGKISEISNVWNALIKKWEDIEKCFLDEVGFNWSKGKSAPKTYNLMKSIIDVASQ